MYKSTIFSKGEGSVVSFHFEKYNVEIWLFCCFLVFAFKKGLSTMTSPWGTFNSIWFFIKSMDASKILLVQNLEFWFTDFCSQRVLGTLGISHSCCSCRWRFTKSREQIFTSINHCKKIMMVMSSYERRITSRLLLSKDDVSFVPLFFDKENWNSGGQMPL